MKENEYVGKCLKDINYNNLCIKGLSIFDDDKEVASGFIGEVLKKIPHLADKEVKSSNYFFDMLVLRV